MRFPSRHRPHFATSSVLAVVLLASGCRRHDLQFTRAYYDALPDAVKPHLTCRVVDRLEPIVQAHTIEGLVMGEAR